MYKQNNKWYSHNNFCFIKPIPKGESFIDGVGVTEEPLWGKIKYSNKSLETLGLKEGDKVSFQPDSEYEFNIEGEKLYRMYTNNITLTDGYQSN
jgi:hypothetical protein